MARTFAIVERPLPGPSLAERSDTDPKGSGQLARSPLFVFPAGLLAHALLYCSPNHGERRSWPRLKR